MADLPSDWPWRDALRGKRAVMVGGDERAAARDRLISYFGLASLDWVRMQSGRLREVQALAQRVQGGTVDIVFALSRYASHNMDNILAAPCRAAGVPFIPLQHGYGVVGARVAVERFIPLHRGLEG